MIAQAAPIRLSPLSKSVKVPHHRLHKPLCVMAYS